MVEQSFVQMFQVTWPIWPMPTYVKNLKKSSSLKSKGRWPWKLVCSIGYSSTTNFVQMMTLGWPWPLLGQGQIWPLWLLYGKRQKQRNGFFSETIVVYDIKVSRCGQPNEYMNLYEYQSQGHSLTFVQGHLDSTFSKKKKSSSLEAKGRCPWNLVSGIGYSSTSKCVQMMTLGWPCPILQQGYTTEAYKVKIGTYSQIIGFMTIYDHPAWRPMSSTDLCPSSLRFNFFS